MAEDYLSKTELRSIIACRTGRNYVLHVTFSDGLEGSLSIAPLFNIGAFTLLRDPGVFETARVGQYAIEWDAGVRLDHGLLYEALSARGFKPRLPTQIAPEFHRFMAQALGPTMKARRAKKKR